MMRLCGLQIFDKKYGRVEIRAMGGQLVLPMLPRAMMMTVESGNTAPTCTRNYH